MIDFHTHVLPGVDDGSKSVEESIEILNVLESQGVAHVFATPHFIPATDSLSDFLTRRDAAYDALSSVYRGGVKIHTGAEISYFPGLTHSSELDRLKLGGTELLLLEMPMEPWSEYIKSEIIELACSARAIPVIAHIERYMDYQRPKVLEQMVESGALMQVNASFFVHLKTRRRAIRLLNEGLFNMIGSDVHGVTYRPSLIDKAFEIINKRARAEATASLMNFCEEELFGARSVQ